MQAFMYRGSSLLFHHINWRFVDGSYSKIHESSSVKIHSRSLGSAKQSFKNVSAMKTRSFFCSSRKIFTTSFEYTFFISKFCRRILWMLVRKISVLPATSLIVFTFYFFNVHALHAVADRPARASSPTDSFHFGNNLTTSSLLYSSKHACHTHSLILS